MPPINVVLALFIALSCVAKTANSAQSLDGKAYGSERAKAQPLAGLPQDFGSVSSGVRVTRLSTTQIQGLSLLGRVWGFLKFHHPRVTAGEMAWDVELLRMLPGILNARNAAEQERLIVEWIDSIGQ